MKRTLLIAVAALMLTPAVFAQSSIYKFDQKQLLQKIKDSDEAIANEKRALRGQTWIDRGDVMFNAGIAPSLGLNGNMSRDKVIEALGKGFTTSTKELDGETFTVMSYPFVDVYLLNDVVQFWNETVTVYDNALEKAYEAYKKGAELDPKLKTKAVEGINNIVNYYKQMAFNHHSLNQDAQAAESFVTVYQLQLEPPISVVDSAAMFNAGYVYLTLNDYDNSIEHFSKARSVGYWQGGTLGYYLMYAYMESDQNEKAKEAITEAARLFPGNKQTIEGLINFYAYAQEDFTEIKDLIITVLEKDPENIVLLTGLGQIYFKQNDWDKAIEIYTKILRIDPENTAANFYLGESLIEKGNEKLQTFQKTQSELKGEARKEALAPIYDIFRKALVPLEKAYQINPDELAVVERLVIVYYRLGEIDPEMDAKYEKFNKIKEEMRAERGLK